MKKLFILLSLSLSLSACQDNPAEPKPLFTESTPTVTQSSGVSIVHNATIYTSDKSKPKVQAFAHRNGKFIAVGLLEELQSSYPEAQSSDMNGATIVPGIIDAHGHLQK